MALSDIAGWNDDKKTGSACTSACGASEKQAACGSACGASDKPDEKQTACGTACGASDK